MRKNTLKRIAAMLMSLAMLLSGLAVAENFGGGVLFEEDTHAHVTVEAPAIAGIPVISVAEVTGGKAEESPAEPESKEAPDAFVPEEPADGDDTESGDADVIPDAEPTPDEDIIPEEQIPDDGPKDDKTDNGLTNDEQAKADDEYSIAPLRFTDCDHENQEPFNDVRPYSVQSANAQTHKILGQQITGIICYDCDTYLKYEVGDVVDMAEELLHVDVNCRLLLVPSVVGSLVHDHAE